MEVRVEEVIINVDIQKPEEIDKKFLQHQADFIKGYFMLSPDLKLAAYIMLSEVAVQLAKMSYNERGKPGNGS